MDDTPTRIAWTHSERDECEARVGHPVRWRGHPNKQGRFGTWRTGRTVVAIDDGPPCWRVHLEPTEHSDGWANPIRFDE
jgi:hypothetical protein